ncbi:MAG TPA: hypothetical protein VMD59_00585 [Acidimicrobiales bacterium]|nr:hypothetical protein [Acidimicrobiales bacterium]
MSIVSQVDFEGRYNQLLMRSWTSEDFTASLLTDPAAALREVGLEVPEGTAVTIDRRLPGGPETEIQARLDKQYQLWVTGIAAGQVQVVVPEVPPVDLAELSENELEAVSGGVDVIIACCCCPCA